MSGSRSRAAAACRFVLVLQLWLLSAARAEAANVPALIVDPSAASRSELSRVIRKALHGMPVTLADDALTTSNLLAVEHANPRDSAGRPFNGRELSRPETFELFRHGSRCVLVQLKNGRSWTLHCTRCAIMAKST